MNGYTAAIAAATDPTYWSRDRLKPYVFDGGLSDLYVLAGIQYDGPGDLPRTTESDALIWANVVVRHTPFEWTKLPDGTLCVHRREWPYFLALPTARFFEARRWNLACGDMQTVDIVTRGFVVDCLANGIDQADVQCLIDSLDPEDQQAVVRAAAALNARS